MRTIIAGEPGISGWIPDSIIGPIQYSAQTLLAVTQQPVKSAAIFSGKDFPRVSRTDSGDRIGGANTRFHEGNSAPEFHCSETVICQIEPRKMVAAKLALIGEVVDREQ